MCAGCTSVQHLERSAEALCLSHTQYMPARLVADGSLDSLRVRPRSRPMTTCGGPWCREPKRDDIVSLEEGGRGVRSKRGSGEREMMSGDDLWSRRRGSAHGCAAHRARAMSRPKCTSRPHLLPGGCRRPGRGAGDGCRCRRAPCRSRRVRCPETERASSLSRCVLHLKRITHDPTA